MTRKEQSRVFLRDYIRGVAVFPSLAWHQKQRATDCLQELGGMAGTWRTDYSECTYYQAQRINGELVDLSTVEKIRAFYERSGAV